MMKKMHKNIWTNEYDKNFDSDWSWRVGMMMNMNKKDLFYMTIMYYHFLSVTNLNVDVIIIFLIYCNEKYLFICIFIYSWKDNNKKNNSEFIYHMINNIIHANKIKKINAKYDLLFEKYELYSFSNEMKCPHPPPRQKKKKKIHSRCRYLISLSLSCYWINNANDTPSACKENLYKARL